MSSDYFRGYYLLQNVQDSRGKAQARSIIGSESKAQVPCVPFRNAWWCVWCGVCVVVVHVVRGGVWGAVLKNELAQLSWRPLSFSLS